MMNILRFVMMAYTACLLSSCAQVPLDHGKILELKPDDKLYTASNLWFDGDREIVHINYHRGKILPFGTEVKIVNALSTEVVFRDVATGAEYKIIRERKYATAKPEAYLKVVFTKKTPEQLVEGIKPEVVEKIRKGQVDRGMTRNETMLSYGYPQPHRTPSVSSDTWIYFDSPEESKRVIFNRRGFVSDVIKNEEVKK